MHGHLPVGLLDPPTSFFKQGAWFSRAYKSGFWDGRIRFLEHDRTLKIWKFPTGLLQGVLEFLDSRQYRYEWADLRTVPDIEPQYDLHPNISLYDYQQAALDAVLLSGRGVVKVATGGGKTEIGAAVIKSVGGQWCWLTHKTLLLHQTRERLSERLQRPIGILGDQIAELEDVTVCMAQTLSQIFKKSGREELRDWFRTCDGILGDEIHHLESDQWYSVFQSTPATWRLGLTATPPLPDQGGMYLQSMTGPVLIDIPTRRLIDQGVLVPPRIWFIPIDQPKMGRGKKDWRAIYSACITDNEYRHQLIADAVRVFSSESKPSLVLVRQIKHGEQIRSVLKKRSLSAGWITGKTSHEDRKCQFEELWNGNLDTIVAQSETIGEGVDLPLLRALINATGTRGGGSAKEAETGRATIQFLGRLLRRSEGKTYCDYVDFSDTGHRSVRRASLDRLETLESEGYSPFIKYWQEYDSEGLQRVG